MGAMYKSRLLAALLLIQEFGFANDGVDDVRGTQDAATHPGDGGDEASVMRFLVPGSACLFAPGVWSLNH
jgi:hypothetical protein